MVFRIVEYITMIIFRIEKIRLFTFRIIVALYQKADSVNSLLIKAI